MLKRQNWQKLDECLEGTVHYDTLHQKLYATDASVYRKLPQAVAFPKSHDDLVKITQFCVENNVPLVPRAAGTSLAGQVVGEGLIVDTSKHLNRILNVDLEKATVRVQPGVIRDELNLHLAKNDLIFGPNTSTSNRCMLGGMVGNNSCGSTSISMGTTRDKILSVKCILSDGSTFLFDQNSDPNQKENRLAFVIFSHLKDLLGKEENRIHISNNYPKQNVQRRNSGYALDALLQMKPFVESGPPLNIAKLICGSEGTLALISEIELQLDPLPHQNRILFAIEFSSIQLALKAVKPLMLHHPFMCELIDDTILNCTKGHPKYGPYLDRFSEIPRGLILAEYRGETSDLQKIVGYITNSSELIKCKRIHQLWNEDGNDMWELRKAGLGLLANLPGDSKTVACIEDTAVSLDDLPDYISEFEDLMQSFGQKAIYYAHAGAGELHLRPVLNLKKEEDIQDFQKISQATAQLVKKYGGSLSGEHGDGRVRAPFLKEFYGEKIYQWFQEIKSTWDPNGIFNPGKIVNPLPLTKELRYEGSEPKEIETILRFDDEGGILRAAEKCNGSGDCRKTEKSAGVMCPSYHITKDEKHTTRGRANVLREVLTHEKGIEGFQSKDLQEVLDLCISCKACASECPSRVDMASLKAVVNFEYYKDKKRPLSHSIFTSNLNPPKGLKTLVFLGTQLMNSGLGRWIKPLIGIHKHRSIPQVSFSSMNRGKISDSKIQNHDVLILADEFTSAYQPELLQFAKEIFECLEIRPQISPIMNSCRAWISKGYLKKAKEEWNLQVDDLWSWASQGKPIIGLEPSSILGYRDEFLRLLDQTDIQKAKKIAKQCLTFSEFFHQQMDNTKYKSIFNSEPVDVHVHSHCHSKALSSEEINLFALGALPGVQVHRIESGCCGMAGSFGFEKEHYEASIQMAELKLAPYIRTIPSNHIVIAHGTSCRHQISDVTQRKAIHPVEFIYQRLKKEQ